jgi:glycosyltransferase involved in cell wall biosynthesis
MKIVLAAVSAAAHLSGVTRHAANVARCLLTRSDVSAVHLLAAPWQYSSLQEAVARDDARLRIHSVHMGTNMLARNLWHYSDLPSVAAQLEADVVHLSYPVPMNRKAFHCPTVVSLHDLYPYDIPANFGFPKALFHRLVLWQCLRAANAIACVSDSTRQRLALRASGSVLEKAVTIYNSVEPAAPMSAQNPFPFWNGQPFLLCVAQHRRNKNIVLAMKIFQRLLRRGDIDPATRLVVVGVSGPETSRIHRFQVAAGMTERIVLLSGISDAEMQWFYSNCEALLAPSIVEGFGLPVAEALLAGCRIVCSDIPAFRELGACDSCRYVPLGPSAEEAFGDAICEVLRQPRSRPCSLPQLSGAVIAEEYMRLYRSLLAFGASSSLSAPILSPTAVQKDRIL